MDNQNITEEVFGKVVSKYTRREAIEDGVLVDITEQSNEAGFKMPVCLSRHLHNVINGIPKSKEGIESYSGRLWDILWMASLKVRGERSKESPEHYLEFQVLMTITSHTTPKPLIQNLIISFSGVDGFTIFYPEDD